MDREALQRAIDTLTIRDVFLQRCESRLAEEFDARFHPAADNLALKWKHRVLHSQIVELEDEDGSKAMLFRVVIAVGILFTLPESADDGTSQQRSAQNKVKECARIEATFVAEYDMQSTLDSEAQRVFALNNASYHVWPYWREYLMSQCARMNLPKVPVPAVQFAYNRRGSKPADDSKH